jgi:hypothetical protein
LGGRFFTPDFSCLFAAEPVKEELQQFGSLEAVVTILLAAGLFHS